MYPVGGYLFENAKNDIYIYILSDNSTLIYLLRNLCNSGNNKNGNKIIITTEF